VDIPTRPAVYASAELSGPSITSFSANAGPGGAVTFSGTVSDDESMEGCIVVIEGPGITAVAVVHNGAFSTGVSGIFGESPITVTAIATDADGNESAPASDTFTPSASGGGRSGPLYSSSGAPLPPPPPPGGP
jgi:hypothetical protein